MSLKRRLIKLEHNLTSNVPPSPVVVYTVNIDGSVDYRGEKYESEDSFLTTLPEVKSDSDQINRIAIQVVDGRKGSQ